MRNRLELLDLKFIAVIMERYLTLSNRDACSGRYPVEAYLSDLKECAKVIGKLAEMERDELKGNAPNVN